MFQVLDKIQNEWGFEADWCGQEECAETIKNVFNDTGKVIEAWTVILSGLSLFLMVVPCMCQQLFILQHEDILCKFTAKLNKNTISTLLTPCYMTIERVCKQSKCTYYQVHSYRSQPASDISPWAILKAHGWRLQWNIFIFVFRFIGYLLDPHTAVAKAVADRQPSTDRPLLLCATAHYGKFASDVLASLGYDISTDFLFGKLEGSTGLPTMHQELARSLRKPCLHRGVVGPNVNEIVDEMKSFVGRAASLNGAREHGVSEVAH